MEARERCLTGDTARAASNGEVREPRREARALKESVAELTLENRLLKCMIGDVQDGGATCTTTQDVSRIRKARDRQDRRAIARAAKWTRDQIGIARRTFYRWYDRYLADGPEALENRPSAPSGCGTASHEVEDQIVEMVLAQVYGL